MSQHVDAFLQTAAEAFRLKSPIYEFAHCPTAEPKCSSDTILSDDEAAKPAEWRTPPAPPETGNWPLLSDEPPRADRFEDLARLPFPSAAAGTVICVDSVEHLHRPHEAIKELVRILSPGGILLVCSTLPSPEASRDKPPWRPTPEAIQRHFTPLAATLIGWQGAQQCPHTVFGIGCKRPVPDEFMEGANRFLDRFAKRLDSLSAAAGWRWKLRRFLSRFSRNEEERSIVRDYYLSQFVLHLPIERDLSKLLPTIDSESRKANGRFNLSR